MKDTVSAVLKSKLPAIWEYKLLTVLGILVIFAAPVCAQHGGGGHGGGFGGHAMGGHSVGHAAGHAAGRIFGSHSGGGAGTSGHGRAEVPPLAGAAMIHGRVVQLPGPGGRNIHPITPHRTPTAFGFRPRRSFFGFGFGFGFDDFGSCSPFDGFFTGYAFGCPLADFSFDPFFGSGYSPDFSGEDSPDEDAGESNQTLVEGMEFQPDVVVEEEAPSPVDKVPHHRHSPHEPDTILQLRDGSMYGLRDYWIDEDRLYYVTNYGGQNSVPLSQIDFAKSSQLNSDRGEKLEVPQDRGTNECKFGTHNSAC